MTTVLLNGAGRRFGMAMGLALIASAIAAPHAFAQSTAPDKDPRRTHAVEHEGPAPGGFSSWTELLTVQDKLVRAAERITAAAGEAKSSGLSGIVLETEQRRLRLHWKGSMPQPVSAVVDALRAQQVGVATVPAAYSAGELAVEAAKITRKPGGKILTVTPNSDGSGLTVSTLGVDGSKHTATASAKTDLAIGDVNVPVTVEAGGTPQPAATRWNDASPWYGGAAWVNAANGGNNCSTAFGVRLSGVFPMSLTAGHCGNVTSPKQIAKDPNGDVMGNITNDNDFFDVQLIMANATGRVYNNTTTPTGAVAAEFSNAVITTTGSFVGQWVCSSGAPSGTRCNIQVKETGVNVWQVDHWVHLSVRAERSAMLNGGGQGDSGGPILAPNPANPDQVYAVGVFHTFEFAPGTPCTGYKTNRLCGWKIYYAPWSTVVSALGNNITIISG